MRRGRWSPCSAWRASRSRCNSWPRPGRRWVGGRGSCLAGGRPPPPLRTRMRGSAPHIQPASHPGPPRPARLQAQRDFVPEGAGGAQPARLQFKQPACVSRGPRLAGGQLPLSVHLAGVGRCRAQGQVCSGGAASRAGRGRPEGAALGSSAATAAAGGGPAHRQACQCSNQKKLTQQVALGAYSRGAQCAPHLQRAARVDPGTAHLVCTQGRSASSAQRQRYELRPTEPHTHRRSSACPCPGAHPRCWSRAPSGPGSPAWCAAPRRRGTRPAARR